MTLDKKYDVCIKEKAKNERYSMQDEKTKLTITANKPYRVITVDDCLITATGDGDKKCDYLVDVNNESTHFFELKGKEVDAAYKQIISTIDCLMNDEQLTSLVSNRSRVDAYIVSANGIQFPKNVDSQKRILARKLAARCLTREKDILALVKHVKTVKKGNLSDANGIITLPSGTLLELK